MKTGKSSAGVNLHKSMMVRLTRILLLSFSPWDEIPLKESLLVPSSSELEDRIMEVKSFQAFLHSHPQVLQSAELWKLLHCSPELSQSKLLLVYKCSFICFCCFCKAYKGQKFLSSYLVAAPLISNSMSRRLQMGRNSYLLLFLH